MDLTVITENKIFDVNNVDSALLNEQRKSLVKLIWEDGDTELWGLVNLLDVICDGIPELWDKETQ